mgnify:CR=1 FL=1
MDISTEHISVSIEEKQGQPHLSLKHGETGREWGPLPLLQFDVFNIMDQRLDPPVTPVVRSQMSVGNGLHLELFDRQHRIALGVLVEIRAGRLAVRLLMSEWFEHDDSAFRLYNVHVLPGLMSVDDAGDLLLPIGPGLQVSPKESPETTDRFLIYGEQSRWELLPNLPVASVGDSRSVLAAVATGCPEDASLRVWTDGKGSGGIDAGACLRENWIDPVDQLDREIEFVPAKPQPDLLHTTAEVLRRHVVEDMKLRSLKDRAAESETIRYLFDAISTKMRFGVLNQGIGRAHPLDPDFGKYLNDLTFSEAADMLKRIKDAGIDHVHTIGVGILPNGHDGCYPSHDIFNSRAGGREGFVKMVEAGNALGYQMQIHDNYNEGYEVSPDFDWRWCSRDLYGQPQKRGRWGGGQAYLQWMRALPEERVEAPMRRLRDLGLTGIGYIDAVGNPLYRNYSPEHGGPRRHHAEGIERVLKAADEIYGGVSIECGFLYSARHCVTVCSPNAPYGTRPFRPEWPLSKLKFDLVPLYRLALSGLIASEKHGNSDKKQMMECLLFGLHPRFNGLSARNASGSHAVNDEFIGRMKTFYDVCCTEYGHLQLERMTRWERESDGVERTAFEDGTDVLADYNKETVEINGARCI